LKITPTTIAGVFLVDIERLSDDRGFFARTSCVREFAEHGLNTAWVQSSISYNQKKGTLRGMHYQAEPAPETKLVRCTAGAVFDVVVDLRPDSATFRQWLGVELSAENRRAIYIPPGIAHGFQTLADETELFYQISEFFRPELSRGVRWDDPAFKIDWPAADPRIMSERDRSYPDLVS
jgi:dTDP-4-dehydrorhamnose 3,5-epimerase